MRFLVAWGGEHDFYGTMTSPQHKGVPAPIKSGGLWGCDLGTIGGPDFVKRFDPESVAWLDTMKPYKSACLFVPVPDWVGNARETLAAFEAWYYHFRGWSLAFVAQDGQEDLPLPDHRLWSTLFVGGTTGWKESEAAYNVILRAQELGKHIHIGRVNWGRRYRIFAQMPGSDTWTCDGTRHRWDGIENTIKDWRGYESENYQLRFPISFSYCGC